MISRARSTERSCGGSYLGLRGIKQASPWEGRTLRSGQSQSLCVFQDFSMNLITRSHVHIMASSFEGCSSFLSSWKEAANKQGGEVLCTRVATLRDHREIWGRKQLQVIASVIQLLKELRPYCDLV